MISATPSLDEVLRRLQEEVRIPTGKTAIEWGNRFPAYREEIGEYVAEWLFQSTFRDEPATFNEARLLNRASSDFQNMLYNYRLYNGTLPGLIAAARKVKLDPEGLAKMVRANIAFLQALERHRITLESIPSQFLLELANALHVNVRSISNWIVSGTGAASGEHAFGASGVEFDNLEQVKSFEQVWRECSLPEEDLDHWKQ